MPPGPDPDAPAGSAGALLLDLLVHGPSPRADVARRLGLSVPSVSRLTGPLVASGRVVEGDPVAASGLGRPSRPLDLVASAESFAGVKLTADSVHVVVTDLRAGVLARGSRPHDDRAGGPGDSTHRPGRSPAAVVDTVVDLLADVAAGRTLTGVGVTLGGRSVDGRDAHDPTFLLWDHVPLADLLEARLGLPVTVANDVDGLTRAQSWTGAGRGVAELALVTVGAGVGLGSVVGGRLVTGRHGAAGDVGHVVVESGPEARRCPAGHLGCAASLLTTAALAELVGGAGGAGGADGPSGAAGAAGAGGAGGAGAAGDVWGLVLATARRGDVAALTAVRRAGSALGRLVGTVATVQDPEVVLVAGEGAALADTVPDDLREGILAVAPWAGDLPVRVQPFAFDEWARGAAAVAVHARMTRAS